MMSGVIRQETWVFFLSVAHGAALALLYDLPRAFRRAVPHRAGAVSAEDFLFWMAAAVLTFCFVFRETEGVIRGYVAAGIAIGAVLYHETLSAWAVKALASVMKSLKWLFLAAVRLLRRGFGKIARFLSVPADKIYKNLKKFIEKPGKKRYNKTKKHKKGSSKKGVRGGKHEKKAKTQ